MEIKISHQNRITIIKEIINSGLFLGDFRSQEGGVITFLEMIWDLRSMPSQDSRFKNARDDIWKHIVMNDDITIEELFLDRLPSTHEDDLIFEKFINTSIHPTVISNDNERISFIDNINRLLKKTSYALIVGDYFGDISVYRLVENDLHISLPIGKSHNNIPFVSESTKNKKYPYPCLILDDGSWNDWFKWRTLFELRYHLNDTEYKIIGNVKIMKREESVTVDHLPKTLFTTLDDSFCSVGQDSEYYKNLRTIFPNEYQSILFSLKDAALYPTIRKQFEDDIAYKSSLLRENEAKQMIDYAKFIVNDIDVNSYYKFSYSFTPPYSDKTDTENTINVDFDFVYNSLFNQRIYSIIGKNGTGKTTFLSKLAHDFSQSEPNSIIPRKPLYNKLITISFSFFDKLPLPKQNAEFNYTYLGLRNSTENIDNALKNKFQSSLNIINDKNRAYLWYSIIKRIIHENLSSSFVEGESVLQQIKISSVMEKYNLFSSGENLLLYVITSLLAEIENSTLILFDEPETHLHPNAISLLMNALYLLTDQFNSFCIIGTHSPLVIQEITSRNVIVFKRSSNKLEADTIGYETFAENITTITDEVFDNREVAKYHYGVLKELIKKNKKKTYEEIIEIVKNDNIPVSLNVQLFIKSELRKDEKS